MRRPWWNVCAPAPSLTRPGALLLCLLAGAPAGAAQEVEHLIAGAVLPTDLPFSEAVRVDDVLYLSGQVGVKPGTLELVDGGMTAQARQTLTNIRTTLEAYGYRLSDVVKCTVMLADIAEWGAFNAVYQQFFSPPYPARSALGANGLALGARVEVECMAVAGRRVDAPRPVPPALPAAPQQPVIGDDDDDDAERTYRRPSRG